MNEAPPPRKLALNRLSVCLPHHRKTTYFDFFAKITFPHPPPPKVGVSAMVLRDGTPSNPLVWHSVRSLFIFFLEIPGLFIFFAFWLDREYKPINFAHACVVCFLCHKGLTTTSFLLPWPPLHSSYAPVLLDVTPEDYQYSYFMPFGCADGLLL